MESHESSEAWSSLSMPSNVQSVEDSLKNGAQDDSGERSRIGSDDGHSSGEEIESPLRAEQEQFSPPKSAVAEGRAGHAADPSGQRAPLPKADGVLHGQNDIAQEDNTPAEAGNWWSSITSSVKKVAEGVAKDIDELNESFHHMLTELDQEEEEEADGPQRSASAGGDFARGPPSGNEEVEAGSETTSQREEVLRRLEGEDTHLEAGLKALDDQVGQVTEGVGRAIGSLWGQAVAGGTSLGQMVVGQAGKEEDGAAAGGIRSEGESPLRQRGASLLGGVAGPSWLASSIASQAEKTFKALDKKAARLFDPETSGPTDPSATYAHYWRECGGQQSLEELETLSNECARVCNQRRSKLGAKGQERVDQALASLAPTFDVQALTTPPGVTDPEEEGGGVALHGQAVITALRDAALQRAEKAGKGPPGSGQPTPAAADEGGDQDKEGRFGEAKVQLSKAYAEGARALAEFCGVSVERLHTLGKSLHYQARYQRRDGGFDWPVAPLEKAQLLRQQARALLSDLQALAAAFVASLASRVEAATAATGGSKALQEAADSLKTELLKHHSSSVAHVQEAFRALMQVVMLFVDERSDDGNKASSPVKAASTPQEADATEKVES